MSRRITLKFTSGALLLYNYNIYMNAILNKLIDWSRAINGQVDKFLTGTQNTDVWFIGGFVLTGLILAMIFKRRRMVMFALAIYVVTALYQALPFDWGLKFGNNVWIFLAAVIAVFVILKISFSGSFQGADYTGRIKSFLFSFIVVGFLISRALNFVTNADILNNIELVNRLFSGDTSRAIWAVLPLIGFLILK